jgi:hypothetical protein
MALGEGKGAEERDEVGTSGATRRGNLVTSSRWGTEKQNGNECHRAPAYNMTVLPLPVGLLTPILFTPLFKALIQAWMTST